MTDLWTSFVGVLYGWLSSFVSGLINLLPTGWALPPEVLDSAYYLGTFLERWNGVLPVDTLVTVLVYLFSFEFAVLVLKLTLLAFTALRGVHLS